MDDVAGTGYPPAPDCDTVSVLRGTRVSNPCRWMEIADDPALQDWLSAQDELTSRYLDDAAIKSRIDAILACLPAYVPQRLAIRRNQQLFFCEPSTDRCSIVLLRKSGTETVAAFDAAEACPGTGLRLDADFVFISPSGRYAAIGLAPLGSDSRVIRIHDLSTGGLLPDTFPETLNPAVAWLPDETGFFYNRTWSKLYGGARVDGVYRHQLHTQSDDDDLIYDYSDGAGHAMLPHLAADGTRLYLKSFNFVTQRAGLLMGSPVDGPAFKTLIPDAETPFNLVGEHDDTLFIETRQDADNGRILSCDLSKQGAAIWQEVVPECPRAIARTTHACASRLTTLAGDRLFVTYETDACSRVDMFTLNGAALGTVPLPAYSTVLDVVADQENASVEIATTTYLVPFTHYQYTIATGSLRELDAVDAGIDVSGITVSRHRTRAADGTEIPMFVLQPESRGEGPQPVMMYGYGGWGSSMTPRYLPDLLAWVALGGSYVVPNTRGGGEFGEAWHRAGRGMRKQTAFSDFEAALEYLGAAGIATPETLVIRGLSAGGLLVTAVLNRRPELFAAAVAEVPLVDVMHIMDTPVGPAIAAELGDPTADAESFEYMLTYSPLQNIRQHPKRPDIMVVPADRDERVAASWSYKYVARLQETALPGQAVLLRRVPGEGHVGWPWRTMRNVLSDELTFFCKALGEAGPTGTSS